MSLVVVTGGSRGIGFAAARLLASHGATVAVLARTEAAAERAAAALAAVDGPGPQRRHRGYACDVADAQAVRDVFKRVAEELGPVELLVNAAGITHSQLLVRTTDADIAAVLNTNLLGVVHTSRAAVRAMLPRRHGCIVSIGSVVGVGGNDGQAIYSASKAALVAAGRAGFSRSLAKEVGRHGIRSNVIAAGIIETDMTSALPPEQRQRLIERTALGRIGRPEDIAAAVLYLANAAYVTGHVLHVDGGISL